MLSSPLKLRQKVAGRNLAQRWEIAAYLLSTRALPPRTLHEQGMRLTESDT